MKYLNGNVLSEIWTAVIVILIGLKTIGWINWPWLVVLLPVWIVMVLALILLLVLVAMRYL